MPSINIDCLLNVFSILPPAAVDVGPGLLQIGPIMEPVRKVGGGPPICPYRGRVPTRVPAEKVEKGREMRK